MFRKEMEKGRMKGRNAREMLKEVEERAKRESLKECGEGK